MAYLSEIIGGCVSEAGVAEAGTAALEQELSTEIKIFMSLEIVQKLTDSTVAAAVAKTLFPSSSFSHPPDSVSLK